MPLRIEAGLYGINAENSNRSGADLWGKNQFNSTFPLSLCIFMRDEGIRPVSVCMHEGRFLAKDTLWEMRRVIGDKDEKGSKTHYAFEESFEPYRKLSRNTVDNIDLVVSKNKAHTIPLEMKLTVVPDSATSKKPEREWAPELVVRPVSSSYAMMGVASSLLDNKNRHIHENVIDAIRPAYNMISDWSNPKEANLNFVYLSEALKKTLRLCEYIQKPFLVQPIWKTMGQSLELCEHCFDVFVWSDVAVMAITLTESNSSAIRPFREIVRHLRSLYDILQTGDYDYTGIYKGMSYGSQTDKSFAIGGRSSIRYLRHDRLIKPVLPKTILSKIILNGGESMLKPERRFDAAVQSHMKLERS